MVKNEKKVKGKLKRKRKKEKMRRRLISMSFCFCTLLLFGFLVVNYSRNMNEKIMGCKTSVYGLDISKLSKEEAAEKILDEFEKVEVVFKEENQKEYRASMKEMGLMLSYDLVMEELVKIKSQKEKNGFFQRKKEFQPDLPIQRKKNAKIDVWETSYWGENKKRTAAKDAYIAYDEETAEFIIVDEVKGNQIDVEKLVNDVEGILRKNFGKIIQTSTLAIEIDSQMYKNADIITADELKKKQDKRNKELQAYKEVSITYVFGEVEEVIDAKTVFSWFLFDDAKIKVDEEAVRLYVTDLGKKYNTVYVTRKFRNSYGNEVEITGNEYGFRIDVEEETQKLLEDVANGTAVKREPIYNKEGLARNGTDDLVGSYIEVSLDNQHLWLYKNGVLITETDIISGRPTEDRVTLRGAWPIPYKASPFTLSSDVYGYEREVTYWMPFVYGQGLHDAPWQSSFGGELYKTRGSHGCINLPPEQAELVYNTIEGGYPIIIY